ncbi:hypothetical protein CO058_00490 [candidate division WWE3 bacterium CG_4_9_14_0_2_um_filter_35_11]|uniref:Uncharacterized protein n=1 Tax=candidate division WWE3 bacterium CG_4_9_14_0_2_um_filter_35_11 TaxID=1975077 RepID=A0A2M8EMP7_UNCKA|nr:MAG: hypothetical protein COV25_01560 [candidate division WWE3 bacterium CG10_big_fil_rev_8_21_14_0_10_35_32]PJC24016.1 MAG: hypothetical protein CO058_00490 [candidate division WWE3 bacterium CG_4_9_14_0_2_um_filter_35_11]
MSKKIYFLIISFLYFIFNILLYSFGLQKNSYIVSFFVFGFIGILIYSFRKIFKNRRGVFFKVMFVSLCAFSAMLVLDAFPTLSVYPKLAYIFASSFGLYLLLLSINIYIVSESSEETIPLLQPAKSVVYAYQLMTVFFSSIIIYKFSPYVEYPVVSLVIQSAFFLAFYYLLFRSIRWFYMMEGALNSPESKLITIVRLSVFAYVFLSEVSIILVFYPLEDFARGMLSAGALFVTSNLINNYLIHRISNRLLLDSLLILSFLYLITNFL